MYVIHGELKVSIKIGRRRVSYQISRGRRLSQSLELFCVSGSVVGVGLFDPGYLKSLSL